MERQVHRDEGYYGGEPSGTTSYWSNDDGGWNNNGGEYYNHHHAGHKRPLPNSADFVKLYVGAVPRTATEPEIRSVFEEYGPVLEVVLLTDKRTGLQQECCFVKYVTTEEADRAIYSLHGQYTFPGGMLPVKVKYADGERERLGSFGQHKLYVGGLDKQALKWEIEEIFSPFGVIEDIFVLRDDFKQSRGSAFVQFSCRDMALAAIRALHGTYVARGCDQPLIVRFADPKKPRTGDKRSAQCFTEPFRGHTFPGENHMMKSPNGCKLPMTASPSAASSMYSSPDMVHLPDCDWSEHVCPDGNLYYYNCVTCESRWEKPSEYELYEQELDRIEQQHQQLQQELKELNYVHGQASLPVFEPAAVNGM